MWDNPILQWMKVRMMCNVIFSSILVDDAEEGYKGVWEERYAFMGDKPILQWLRARVML